MLQLTEKDWLEVIIELGQESRLSRTCFRGTVRKAGNFQLWPNLAAYCTDPETIKLLTPLLTSTTTARRLRHTITYPAPIGWASTIPLSALTPADTEPRPLNKKAKALFVTNPSIKAPLTQDVTFVITREYKPLNGFNLHRIEFETIYPGPNVGQLSGDMSRKRGVAFFDWEAEGE